MHLAGVRQQPRQFAKGRMVTPLLVIGSVHVDIIVDVAPKTRQNLDKMGRLQYAVGGTAFNVASNLVHQGIPVLLYSAIKRGGFASPIIRRELARRGLGKEFVREDRLMPESGFIAHMQNGVLTTAVSCIGIEDVEFDDWELTRAIGKCSLVAVECNLAVRQIQQILKIATGLNRPVCISAVSESKVERISQAVKSRAGRAFRFVIMNELEAKKAMGTSFVNGKRVCEVFSSENVVITHGCSGFTVLTRHAKPRKFNAPIINVSSSLGAGDALFSAFCSHFSRHSTLDKGDIANEAKKFLGPVLSSHSAVPERTSRSDSIR